MNGLTATAEILELARGLGETDVAIVLISGGGSALLEQFPSSITLAEARRTMEALLRSGADIAAMNLQLEVSRQTLQANEEAVVFYQKRLQGGLSNRLEVDSALANRARTAAVIPQLEQQLAEAESALCVLLRRPPGPIERGETLAAKLLPPRIPAGLPATLLEQRPDVLAAEQALVAANADIGAAKALFFPSISLTGALGGASADFSDLLEDDAEVWQVNPSLFAPVFQGGRIRSNYEAAQARYEQAFAQYSKSALNAYRETADAIAAVENLAAVRVTLEGGARGR